jgi:membrane associated rhomboid family serine protease
MFSFLNNIPQVTKNLLIINVLLFLITFFFHTRGIVLEQILGAHYVNSPLFEPYQVVTHFFMHANLAHIAFNMFALVTFGGFLERLWGPKRFFILFVGAAIGAFALYNAIGVYQIIELKQQLQARGLDVDSINNLMKEGRYWVIEDPGLKALQERYLDMCRTPMLGASGGVFGVLAAFVILFPNTQLMMLFFPVPVKAKYLIGGYILLELVLSFQQIEGDTTAHLAHVGGAIIGAALVLIWRRNKTHFY